MYRKSKALLVMVVVVLAMLGVVGAVVAAPDAPQATTLVKTVEGPSMAEAGDVLTYTVVVTPDPASAGMMFYFVDPVMMGLSSVNVIEAPENVVWTSTMHAVMGPVTLMDPFTVTFSVEVTEDAMGETIVNQAGLCKEETNSLMLCRPLSNEVETETPTKVWVFLPFIVKMAE